MPQSQKRTRKRGVRRESRSKRPSRTILSCRKELPPECRRLLDRISEQLESHYLWIKWLSELPWGYCGAFMKLQEGGGGGGMPPDPPPWPPA